MCFLQKKASFLFYSFKGSTAIAGTGLPAFQVPGVLFNIVWDLINPAMSRPMSLYLPQVETQETEDVPGLSSESGNQSINRN